MFFQYLSYFSCEFLVYFQKLYTSEKVSYSMLNPMMHNNVS